MALSLFVAASLFSTVLRCDSVQLRQNGTGTSESYKPIMMFSHGCSMTTAGINLLESLLEGHGIKTADKGHGELMKSLDNYSSKEELKLSMGAFGQEDDLINKVASYNSNHLKEKFQVVYKWAKSRGETLFWKQEASMAQEHSKVMEYLKEIGTKAFLYRRTNLLDVLHCRVNDFCDGIMNREVGYLVNAQGKGQACGFRGRDAATPGKSSNEKEKEATYVKLDTHRLIDLLKRAEGGDEIHERYLEKRGFNHKVRSAEDLFEFEYAKSTSSNEFQKSLKAWTDLIESLGIQPKDKVIEKALLDFGKFPPPKKHYEMFYNYEEIKKVLMHSKFYDMLRT